MSICEKYELSKAEWEYLIDQWIIGRNGERNRAILRRRLFDGVTFERLAEEFDLSTQHVQEIVHNGQHRLCRCMEARGKSVDNPIKTRE